MAPDLSWVDLNLCRCLIVWNLLWPLWTTCFQQNLSDHDLQKFPKLHAPWVLMYHRWVTVSVLLTCRLFPAAFYTSARLISLLLDTSEWLNGVWSSLCTCAPGWFPRSALRSARRMRKEGCSVGRMFQMTQLCPKYGVVHIKHTWRTVVAPMWLWLCFLFIAELRQNIKNQVWTLSYEIIRSDRKQLNLQLLFCINGLVTVEQLHRCMMCSIGVFFVCVCAEVTAESQGWDEDEFVCFPFLVFLSKNIFLSQIHFCALHYMDMLYFSLLVLAFC